VGISHVLPFKNQIFIRLRHPGKYCPFMSPQISNMKKAIPLLALCLAATAMQTRAQQIKSVSVTADNPAYSGGCPARITFTATIHYSGSGSVQYTWLRSDGAHAPTKTIALSGSGTQTLTTYWQLGKSFQGWQALKIVSPGSYESQHADFSLACNGLPPAKGPGPVASPSRANLPAGPVSTTPSHANLPAGTMSPTPSRTSMPASTVTPANSRTNAPAGTAASGNSRGNVPSGPVPPVAARLQVQNVQVSVDKPSYNGSCPVTVNFSAVVHFTGSGTIRYTWVTSDGGSNATFTKQLSGTGTDELDKHAWQLGKSFAGTASLKILSPVQYQSAPVRFRVGCNANQPVKTKG
jgi:hypothetical protein